MGGYIITIVSGVPRSGTSLMMSMLESGGIQVVTDNLREADEDNLRGYYEYERVKQLEQDQSWLPLAEGKVVKLISALLIHLPPEYYYKIIFMRRKIDEILASQKKMIERRGEQSKPVPDEMMAQIFNTHIKEVHDWMDSQQNIEYIDVNYNKLLIESQVEIERVSKFLDRKLNTLKMKKVIEPRLYRQRK